MALFGQGDPRWIVHSREDGKNVNNWHWTETDFTNWAKNKLAEYTENQKFENTKISCTTSTLTLPVDVSVNTRKQKTIVFYELDASLKWEGTWLASGKTGKGLVRMPYISEENNEDEFEIQVTVEDDTNSNDLFKLKEELRKEITPLLKKSVPTMLQQLREVAADKTKLPQKQQPVTAKILDQIPVPSTSTSTTTTTPTPLTTSKQSTNSLSPTTSTSQSTSPSTSSSEMRTCTITMKEKFLCTPRDLFDCLVVPARVKAYAGGDADISAQKGSKFSLFGGSVSGEIVNVNAPTKLVQNWRFSSWPSGYFSTVTIQLEEKDGKTILKLTHEGVPEEDKERTESGWSANFWKRIKGIFGYGSIY